MTDKENDRIMRELLELQASVKDGTCSTVKKYAGGFYRETKPVEEKNESVYGPRRGSKWRGD